MVNRTDLVASFGKGLRVLECFGPDHPRQTISDVAAATGFDRSTARRCLLTLNSLGYADYDGKWFSLTPRVLRLGAGALAALPLPQIVQPWLDQLSDQIGHNCSVCILDDLDIVYVARAAKRRVMSVGLLPGSRLPAHCTAMGRLLLGALPAAEARSVIDRSDLSPRTVYSRTTPEDIWSEVAKARTQGYCIVDQEVELGVRSLAVPVVNAKGKVVAALNAGMPATPADPAESISCVLPSLLKVQEGLRRVLP